MLANLSSIDFLKTIWGRRRGGVEWAELEIRERRGVILEDGKVKILVGVFRALLYGKRLSFGGEEEDETNAIFIFSIEFNKTPIEINGSWRVVRSSGRPRYNSSGKGGLRGDSFRARGNFGSGRGGYGRHEIRHPGDFSGQPKGSGGWNGDNNPKGINRMEGVAIKGGQKQHDSTWE